MEPSNFVNGKNPSWEDFLAESFGDLNVGASTSGSPNIFTQTFDNPNIWNAGYQTLYQGDNFRSDIPNSGPSSSYYNEYQNSDSQCQPEYLAAGVLAPQSRMRSMFGRSLEYAALNQNGSSLRLSYGPSSRPPELDTTNYYRTRMNGNYELVTESRYAMTSRELRNRNGLWNQRRITRKEIESLLLRFRGKISSLMLDESYHPCFDVLVDSCEGAHLNFLMAEIVSESHLFVASAFTTQGSSSIMNLTKKLKKTDHAFTLTKILSERFYDIATHPTARNVIQTCLCIFESGPNMVLYEHIDEYFQCLAKHQVGCRFLNSCITTIAGDQRMGLLNRVAQNSDNMSNDPYGNYVVQHVFDLRNSVVNGMIVTKLSGQFISLARKKVGSHVVEKCLESSDTAGIYTVVNEILRDPQAPFELAKDQFGNFVIQKALKYTKGLRSNELYESLSKALRPYSWELKQTSGGKCVMNVLERGRQTEMLMNSDYPGFQALGFLYP